MLSRRSLFGGLAALLVAPPIVRAASIMPVTVPKIIESAWIKYSGYDVINIGAEDVFGAADYPWSSLADIVATTIRERPAEIADNVSRNNALFARLSARRRPLSA